MTEVFANIGTVILVLLVVGSFVWPYLKENVFHSSSRIKQQVNDEFNYIEKSNELRSLSDGLFEAEPVIYIGPANDAYGNYEVEVITATDFYLCVQHQDLEIAFDAAREALLKLS